MGLKWRSIKNIALEADTLSESLCNALPEPLKTPSGNKPKYKTPCVSSAHITVRFWD